MDMEAGKTLTNEEVIRELLDLLKKNAMKEQANDVFEICSYVDGLEKKTISTMRWQMFFGYFSALRTRPE